jgi:hypothetical protein
LKFLLLSKITPEYRTDSLSQASFSAITNEDSSTDLLFDSTVYTLIYPHLSSTSTYSPAKFSKPDNINYKSNGV